MNEDDAKILEGIRKRDDDYGDYLPERWTAQWDRRNLLRMLDAAEKEIQKYEGNDGY